MGMFRNLPSATLKQLVKLSARKEALLAQLQAIDREMVRLEQSTACPPGAAGQGDGFWNGRQIETETREAELTRSIVGRRFSPPFRDVGGQEWPPYKSPWPIR